MYGTRDALGRYDRRIFKQAINQNVVESEIFDSRKTACGHNDIDYVDKFRGKTDVQVKAHVMLRLNDVTKKKKERDGEENDTDNEDEGKNKKEYNPTQRSR